MSGSRTPWEGEVHGVVAHLVEDVAAVPGVDCPVCALRKVSLPLCPLEDSALMEVCSLLPRLAEHSGGILSRNGIPPRRSCNPRFCSGQETRSKALWDAQGWEGPTSLRVRQIEIEATQMMSA